MIKANGVPGDSARMLVAINGGINIRKRKCFIFLTVPTAARKSATMRKSIVPFDDKEKQKISDVLNGKELESELNSVQFIELLNFRCEVEKGKADADEDEFIAWWFNK